MYFCRSKSPRTGIVRKCMKIKQNNELSILAIAAGKTANEISKQIICELVQHDIICDDRENWGYRIFDCINTDVPILNVIEVMHHVGIFNITASLFDAFMNSVLIGCGDCPECGGDMEVVDGEYICCGGDGYITPYEYEPIWETMKCNNCGYSYNL